MKKAAVMILYTSTHICLPHMTISSEIFSKSLNNLFKGTSVFPALTFENREFQGHFGKICHVFEAGVKCGQFIFGANISNIPTLSSPTGFICQTCVPLMKEVRGGFCLSLTRHL